MGILTTAMATVTRIPMAITHTVTDTDLTRTDIATVPTITRVITLTDIIVPAATAVPSYLRFSDDSLARVTIADRSTA